MHKQTEKSFFYLLRLGRIKLKSVNNGNVRKLLYSLNTI